MLHQANGRQMDMISDCQTVNGVYNSSAEMLEQMLVMVDDAAPMSVAPPPATTIPIPFVDMNDYISQEPSTLVFTESDARLSMSTASTCSSSSSGRVLLDATIDTLLLGDDNGSNDFYFFGECKGRTGTSSQAQGKPRKKRRRPKDELDYLRAKVAEMKCELLRLQQLNKNATMRNVRAAANLTNIFAMTSKLDATSPMVLQALWKEMATHHQNEATQSVIENMKLRALLESQLQLAKQLEIALLEQQQSQFKANAQPDDDTIPLMLFPLSTRAANYTDTIAFSTLGHDFKKQLQQTDEVFSAWCDTSFPTDNTPCVRLYDHYFELFASHTLPFTVPAVDHALWHTMTRAIINVDGSVYELHKIDGDSVYAKLTDTLRLSTCKATMDTWIKVRRVVEGTRVILITESLVDTDAPISLRLREVSWNVLIPQDDAATTMQICGRGYPNVDGIDRRRQQKWGDEVGSITDLVIPAYRRRIQLIHQLVGHLLLNMNENFCL